MTTTRRAFLQKSAFAAAGLCLAAALDDVRLWSSGADTEFRPSVFLQIGSDNQIRFWVTRSEMGQGVRTVLPAMLAEELEVDPARLILLQAATTPEFAKVRLRTSGSSSSTTTWKSMRLAGATAREMLRSAAAQQWKVEPATCRAAEGAIHHDATGRSLRYGALAAAAAQIPVPSAAPLKEAKDFRVVGKPRRRVDGPDIVSGRAMYGLDFKLPGMRYAVTARAPMFGDKPLRWDDTAARKLPGVREIAAISTGLAVGVAVTADDTWTAIKARDLLQVEWASGPHREFNSEDFYAKLRSALHDERDSYLVRKEGSFAEQKQQATGVLDAVYEWPYQAHATMEPMNCTADVKADSCDVWVPTQAPEEAQARAAKLLGLAPSAVRVHVTLVGGGFGRRLFTDYVLEAVELSKAIGHPVRLMWTRDEDMKFGYYNPPSFNRIVAALDGSGKLMAWRHRVASSDLSIYPQTSTDPNRYANDGSPWGAYDTPYDFPALLVDYVPMESPVPTGPWRSVEYPGPVFARECFLDEVAHHAGMDPIALRLQLLPPNEVSLGNAKLDRRRLATVLELVREKSGWNAPRQRLAERRWGRGVACNVYDTETYMAQVAEVSVGSDGDVKVHRVVCAVDLGQPINPLGIAGQVESGIAWGLTSTLKSSMSFRDGQAQAGNFADYDVLRFSEMPAVETHVVPSQLPPCGLGEQPVPCIMPAVANAVFAATGKRIRRLPITAADLA